jgi:hypothetical protein
MGSVSTRWACKIFHLAFKNVSKSPKKVLQMWFDSENELVNVAFINNCSDFVIISFMSLIHLCIEFTYFILI